MKGMAQGFLDFNEGGALPCDGDLQPSLADSPFASTDLRHRNHRPTGAMSNVLLASAER